MGKTTPQTDIARDVNRNVLSTAAIFDDLVSADDHARLEFRCECGCLGAVPMSPADYVEQNGAWLPGHYPDESVAAAS